MEVGKTYFFHERNLVKTNKISGPTFEVSNKGGITFAVIKEGDSKYKIAAAVCSLSDNFNKKRGREIAEGRARKHGRTIVVDEGAITMHDVYRQVLATMRQWFWEDIAIFGKDPAHSGYQRTVEHILGPF